MNRQIGELTNLVLALIHELSSNPRERNGLNMATTNANSRSDMVTGVQNPQPSGSRAASPNETPRSDVSAPQLTDVVTENHHLGNTMGDTITQSKILQTLQNSQVPLFKGNREKYNEFEHLLLNQLGPHAHELIEEQKLDYSSYGMMPLNFGIVNQNGNNATRHYSCIQKRIRKGTTNRSFEA